MNGPTIEISINVTELSPGSEVPPGEQLADNGKYHYKFTPDNVTVTESPTTLRYHLDSQSAGRYEITGLVSTDTLDQFETPQVSTGGNAVSVVDRNTQAELIDVTVQITDRVKDVPFGCDPQVENEPKPHL